MNLRYPTSYSTVIQHMDLSTTVCSLKTTSGLVEFFKMVVAAILDFHNFQINVKDRKAEQVHYVSSC